MCTGHRPWHFSCISSLHPPTAPCEGVCHPPRFAHVEAETQGLTHIEQQTPSLVSSRVGVQTDEGSLVASNERVKNDLKMYKTGWEPSLGARPGKQTAHATQSQRETSAVVSR